MGNRFRLGVVKAQALEMKVLFAGFAADIDSTFKHLSQVRVRQYQATCAFVGLQAHEGACNLMALFLRHVHTEGTTQKRGHILANGNVHTACKQHTTSKDLQAESGGASVVTLPSLSSSSSSLPLTDHSPHTIFFGIAQPGR